MTEEVPVGAYLRGGSLRPSLSEWLGNAWYCVLGESFRVTRRGVGVTRRGGPGPPLGLAARWVSESKLRGPQ